MTNFTESWFFHMLRRLVRLVFQVYGAFFGSPLLWEVIGPTYLQDFFESYIVEFFSSAAHLDSLVHLIWGTAQTAARAGRGRARAAGEGRGGG